MKIFTLYRLYIAYIGLLLLPILQLRAQPTNSTAPKPGDVSTGEYAFIAAVLPGSMGANQIWDYQNLVDSAAESLTKFISPTATPYYSDFPTASLAANIDDTLYSYYTISGGNLLLLGGKSAQERFEYAHPYITAHYPITYGDKYLDSASLYLTLQSQKDTTLMLDTTEVTGYGTLKLPKKTYNNVLQLRHINVAVARFYFPGVGEIKLPPAADTTFSYFVDGIVSPLLFYSTSKGQIQLISYYKASALPLDFIKFSATPGRQGVHLNWETADEINTSNFRIQRSLDGQHYSDIQLLQAKGKTHNTYQFTDSISSLQSAFSADNSNNLQSRVIYYRIQQTDLDDHFSFSPVVTCLWLNKAPMSLSYSLSLYPNPVRNKLHISGTTGLSWYRIYGSTGQLLLKGAIQSDNTVISVTTLPAGIYFFEAGAKDIVSKKKIQFIKK